MSHTALPPGPPEHPLLQAAHFGRDPYAYLEACVRRFGAVFTLRLPGDPPRIVVSEPALIRQIFAMKPDEYEARNAQVPINLGPQSLLFLDGDMHRRDRQLLTPPLHGECLKSYARAMQEITREVLARLTPGTRVPLLPLLQDITLDIILHCVFGAGDRAAAQRLRRPVVEWLDGVLLPATFFAGMVVGWSRVRAFLDRAVARAASDMPSPLARLLPWNRVGAAKAEVIAHLRNDLERCRAERSAGRTDILAMLAGARYEDQSPMAIDHAIDELITMLVGGHETTSNTMAWALCHILPRADVRARIDEELAQTFGGGPVAAERANELKYLDACLKEAMRRSPIAPAIPRILSRRYVLGEWTLPEGTVLFPCVYATHHREDLWPEPYTYKPERFLDATPATDRFFPFGGGRRACIGMAFASFEMRIVLATLLSESKLRLGELELSRPMFRGLTIAPKRATVWVEAVSPRHGQGGTHLPG